jgi:hypothetical protein
MWKMWMRKYCCCLERALPLDDIAPGYRYVHRLGVTWRTGGRHNYRSGLIKRGWFLNGASTISAGGRS